MKRIMLTLMGCIIVVAACQSTTQSQIKQADAHRKLGEAHILDENYVAALRELMAAQKMNPTDPVVYNDMGIVYMNRDKLPEAQHHFHKALSLKPDYGDAQLNLAVTFLVLGQWDAAIENLKALESDMLFAAPQKVNLNLGYAYYMKEDFTAASKFYTAAIRHFEDGFPKDITYVMALLGQARVSLKTGNPTKALALIDGAVTLAPQVPALHFYRGEALEQLGNSATARNAYLKVIELAPEGDLSQKAMTALRRMAG